MFEELPRAKPYRKSAGRCDVKAVHPQLCCKFRCTRYLRAPRLGSRRRLRSTALPPRWKFPRPRYAADRGPGVRARTIISFSKIAAYRLLPCAREDGGRARGRRLMGFQRSPLRSGAPALHAEFLSSAGLLSSNHIYTDSISLRLAHSRARIARRKRWSERRSGHVAAHSGYPRERRYPAATPSASPSMMRRPMWSANSRPPAAALW